MDYAWAATASRSVVSRAPAGGDWDPAFSPDGRSIAFHRFFLGPDKECCRSTGIWIIGPDGSDPHQVTNLDPKPPEACHHYGPGFSPDGKTLVFDREQRKKVPEFVQLGDDEPYYHAAFVQSLDSSGSPEDAHQITPWKMNCQSQPEFSPDAKLVLFLCASPRVMRVRSVPSTFTGYTPMARACTRSPTRRMPLSSTSALASLLASQVGRAG